LYAVCNDGFCISLHEKRIAENDFKPVPKQRVERESRRKKKARR
jgi:hypothetical protein